jgi:hypothetical protein
MLEARGGIPIPAGFMSSCRRYAERALPLNKKSGPCHAAANLTGRYAKVRSNTLDSTRLLLA